MIMRWYTVEVFTSEITSTINEDGTGNPYNYLKSSDHASKLLILYNKAVREFS